METIKVFPTLKMIRARRTEILDVATQFGASNVRVFGSVARDDATPESDLDLLVTMRPEASMFDVVGLWLAMKELLGIEVSVVEDQALDGDFANQVMMDAIAL